MCRQRVKTKISLDRRQAEPGQHRAETAREGLICELDIQLLKNNLILILQIAKVGSIEWRLENAVPRASADDLESQ